MPREVPWDRMNARAGMPSEPATSHRTYRFTRYPIWNARGLVLVALLDVAVVAVLVFGLGHRSLFVRTELALGLVAASLFVFLALGLYRGIRVRKEEFKLPTGGDRKWSSGMDVMPDVSLELADFGIDLGGGIVGAILGLLLSIVAATLLVLPAWVVLSFLWGGLIVVVLAVFWVFNRALRQVFARSRRCRGDLSASLGYAFL